MRATVANQKSKSQQLSGVGLKTFFNIASAWKLKNDQEMILLGSPGRSNFYNWKRNPSAANLNRDTLERISYILEYTKHCRFFCQILKQLTNGYQSRTQQPYSEEILPWPECCLGMCRTCSWCGNSSMQYGQGGRAE
jgi:hypothetical protein